MVILRVGGLLVVLGVACVLPAISATGEEKTAAKPVITVAVPLRADVGKTVLIEPRAKAIVKDGSAPVEPNANPKVEPGKVKWHKDFAAACDASAKSGKPVLLFQMLGKLDDQFC